MDLKRIKNKVEELHYLGGLKALASAVGMTEQNLHRCVRENKIQAQDLEKIASELNVSVLEFYDEPIETTEIHSAGRDLVVKGKIEHRGTEYNGSAMEADLREQIAQLKSQLADKERIIKLMEDK